MILFLYRPVCLEKSVGNIEDIGYLLWGAAAELAGTSYLFSTVVLSDARFTTLLPVPDGVVSTT